MLTKKDKKKRYNKKTRSLTGHEFDGNKHVTQFTDSFKGENLAGTIGGMLGTVGTAIADVASDPQLQNTDTVDAEINARQNLQVDESSTDSVLAAMAGATNMKEDYSYKDFTRSGGQMAGDIIGGTLAGFGAGTSQGGLIGGAINGIIGLAGKLGKMGREIAAGKKHAKEASKQAKLANLVQAQTLTAAANNVDQNQDARAAAAYAAYGGDINAPKFSDYPSEITEFNTGGSHEENPYDGIPQGIAPDGLPNLVEEGEVKYDNYIFSDRLMLNKNDKKKYKFLKGKTYADAAKAIKKELGIDERPNDLIAKTDLEEHLNILSTLQEEERAKRGLRGENRMMYKNGGHIFGNGSRQEIRDYMDVGFTRRQAKNLANGNFNLDEPTFEWSSLGRAMPAIGSAVGLTSNLFDKPTYEHTKKLTQPEETTTSITYTPTHQDIKLPRFDKSFYMNKADAQAAATRRAIREQTASNPYASTLHLLVADAQGNATRGDIRRQGEEMEINRILQEAQFNSTGRRADAEGFFKADSANATLRDKALSRQAEKDIYAARLNIAEDQAWDTANSANMTSLFDNLGAIGREEKEFALAAIKALGEGKMTPEQLAIYAQQFPGLGKYLGYKGAYGGKLRKKKGYTI